MATMPKKGEHEPYPLTTAGMISLWQFTWENEAKRQQPAPIWQVLQHEESYSNSSNPNASRADKAHDHQEIKKATQYFSQHVDFDA
jgi:hypothetical protein